MFSENRPELALLRGKRGPDVLEKWSAVFGEGRPDTTARYREILDRIARPTAGEGPYVGRYSKETGRAYGHAIAEFFEWCARQHRRPVLPREVSRRDAEDYVAWLADRPFSLEEERLRDGDAEGRLSIYETVKKLGSADLTSIAAELPERLGKNKAALAHGLGRMVLHDLLVRSPTLSELRKTDPQIGIRHFTVPMPGGGAMDLEDVFVYSTPAPRGLSRSTIALRLSALSRLWQELCRGDPETPPLVKFNVFDEILSRVSRGLAADKRASRARKARLTPELVSRLLNAADGQTLVEKRDAALFWFVVLMGSRVSEARLILRDKPRDVHHAPGWLEPLSTPVVVELVRKGGVHHRLPYPPYALRALYAFQTELERHAAPRGSQSEDPRSPGYLQPRSPKWRYKALFEEPDAPLFPPVVFWGANSPELYEEHKPNPLRPDYRRPMSSAGVRAILKKIAKKAGLSPEEERAVHSHAFRHFAATAMARRGKPLREIKTLLGHSSITVTEGYVEDETDLAVLSGQNEILDYIATGETAPGAPAPAPARESPRAPPGAQAAPPRVIETVGVRAPERRPEEPGLPAESPTVGRGPETHEVERGLVAVSAEGPLPPDRFPGKADTSAGSPYYAYADIGSEDSAERETIHFTRVGPARGSTRQTLYEKAGKKMVQEDPFLARHYDPWPLGYGLGEASLLPWFARGAASKHGDVVVDVRTRTGEKKKAVVPPLPVFAPEQLYSELKAKTLFSRVEAMRERFLKEEPTKAFGLDRWWGAFQEISKGLSAGTKGKFRFVPFESAAAVGKDVRAHDDEYLAAWLEKNAGRYTTTVRAFESIDRPRGGARDEEEWAAFREAFAKASLVAVSPAEELPDWFILDDPVKDIWKTNPEEWEWFSKWIGAVTGQKLTSVRKDERASEVRLAEEARRTRIDEARELLKAYFESVETLHRAGRAREKDEADRERETIALLTERLGALGVRDPKTAKELPRTLSARIEMLLAEAFPSAGVELVDPNVLESSLFDKESFRIDRFEHTISHTEAFRAEFAERYDGRDSECVMRRAARGMWEHVKRHGIPIKRGTERSSEYSLLYSVMLSYIAWIVPCPPDIEKRMTRVTQGELTGEEARLRYLGAFRKASGRILRVTRDHDEEELLEAAMEEGLDAMGAAEVLEASLVEDSLRARAALPSAPVTEALARTAVESGAVAVSSRRPAVIVARRVGRQVVRDVPVPAATYFSVGDDDEDTELAPNAPPRRYLTPNALRSGLASMRRPEETMPSVLRMMTAMTIGF